MKLTKEKSDVGISKRKLWRYVNKKIDHKVHSSHTFNIISILLEELTKDFKERKSINIYNFGTFYVHTIKPGKIFDIFHKKVVDRKEHSYIRFSFAPKVKKLFYKLLDLDKSSESE